MKKYLEVIRPKVMIGNLISSATGLLIVDNNPFDTFRSFCVILSIFFMISSCFILNNFMDRRVDGMMNRTRDRILTKYDLVQCVYFLLSSFFLLFFGLVILSSVSNFLSICVAVFGISTYFLYTVLKKKTHYSIFLGSLSGSTPPIISYCSVVNRIDLKSIIVYFILFFWQIPHFYSISLLFLRDYLKAKIPILPTKIGLFNTKVHILIYVLIFSIVCTVPFFFRYVGFNYLVAITTMNLSWMLMIINSMIGNTHNSLKRWSKKSLVFSILSINLFDLMLIIDKI
ncbi:protoheme IX farnesyltransferase [Candidatus Riesia pediculischaeffi]|uniref:heme o synthase n=1 Tax=Candidatus Riesia pediculischaeffi TaxID=428411 RepID=A0A1V0HKY5_9ENTR|nr:protoheme IX farnesyltransferase [Candidatus Riesia pediculischaeffi]ARC53402.1 hypothetical protein AOQ87_01905 [Candidatus Riesia pediculischaeffi]